MQNTLGLCCMYMFQQQLPLLRVGLQPRLHDLLNMFNIVRSIFMGHLSLPLAPVYMAKGEGDCFNCQRICLDSMDVSSLWVLVAGAMFQLMGACCKCHGPLACGCVMAEIRSKSVAGATHLACPMAVTNLRFAMYLDEQLYQRYSLNADQWHKDFQDDVIPFALASDGERIALRKFARAYRSKRGTASEYPRWLLQGSIPASSALGHIIQDEVEVMHHRQRMLCACICIRSPNSDTSIMPQHWTHASYHSNWHRHVLRWVHCDHMCYISLTLIEPTLTCPTYSVNVSRSTCTEANSKQRRQKSTKQLPSKTTQISTDAIHIALVQCTY